MQFHKINTHICTVQHVDAGKLGAVQEYRGIYMYIYAVNDNGSIITNLGIRNL